MSALQKEIMEALAPVLEELREIKAQLNSPAELLALHEKAKQVDVHPRTLKRRALEGRHGAIEVKGLGYVFTKDG